MKTQIANVSTTEALSTPGATISFNLIAQASAGSIDLSAYRGRMVRVQVIGTGVSADVWFDASGTSAVNTNDSSSAFENGIGDRLYSGHPPSPVVVPGFIGANSSFLHFNPSASLDIRVTVG